MATEFNNRKRADQATNKECRKLNDSKKEIKEGKYQKELSRIGIESRVVPENNEKKLEWMYQSERQPHNREEYLLGLAVDENFERTQLNENRAEKDIVGVKVHVNHVEHDCVPFSIRQYRNVNTYEQVDLPRKLLEDPLMLIKQKEIESRKKILENPVKLKELHRILKTEKVLQQKSSKIIKPKKKKKKKTASKEKKKHQTLSYDSDEFDNDRGDEYLDKVLKERLVKLRGSREKLTGLNLIKLRDAKYETISKELDKAVQSNLDNRCIEKQTERRNSSERDKTHHSSTQHKRSVSHNKEHKTQKFHHNAISDSKSRGKFSDKMGTKIKPRITEEEKEKRRLEMMQNAIWRDEVQKQRHDLKKEEVTFNVEKFDKQFISKQVKNAFSNQTTLESRIRSNKNNIQRTVAAMNSKFT